MCIRDRRFGVDQRGLACRKLLLLLCQSAGQTFLIGLQLFFAAGDLVFRAVQLRLGVLQLLSLIHICNCSGTAALACTLVQPVSQLFVHIFAAVGCNINIFRVEFA